MKKIIVLSIFLINILLAEQKEEFYNIAMDYKNGINKEQDNNFSRIYLEASAKQGYTKANLELGKIKFQEENYKSAQEYFLKSYEESESKFYLSLLYENGFYVEKNQDKAYQLLKAATEKKDYPKANIKLANIEKKKKNNKEAERLLKEASETGDEESIKEYNKLIKN